MNWYETVFELIDMRSFSNLWFWIALAVLWSSVSHWVLGVPYDMVQRASRQGGQAEQDLEDLVRINVNRILGLMRMTGLWMIGLTSAVLTGLGLLGFVYRIEFAQAVFLLCFPLAIVGGVTVATAQKIQVNGLNGDHLRRALRFQRLYTQLIGVIAIFTTALWGMYQNMTFGALGN